MEIIGELGPKRSSGGRRGCYTMKGGVLPIVRVYGMTCRGSREKVERKILQIQMCGSRFDKQ